MLKGMIYLIVCLLLNAFWLSSSQDILQNENSEILLCRKCGADVAETTYIFNKLSPNSQKTEIKDLFGQKNVTIQTLRNHYGTTFRILTTEKARCENVGTKHGADTWFPGHTWQICSCPQCGQHLGWTFENGDPHSKNTVFHGLVITNILEEHFTSNLVLPKIYRT